MLAVILPVAFPEPYSGGENEAHKTQKRDKTGHIQVDVA
jgi:hypothetical protein